MIPGSNHKLGVICEDGDVFSIEIDQIPFERYPFWSPHRNLVAGYG